MWGTPSPEQGTQGGKHQLPDVHTWVRAQWLPSRAGRRGPWGCLQSVTEATGSTIYALSCAHHPCQGRGADF